MEDLNKVLTVGFGFGDLAIKRNSKRFNEVNKTLDAFLERAKQTLMQKQVINPKPQKRIMRIVESEELKDFTSENIPQRNSSSRGSNEDSLRPVRTAKSKANLNLKEIPSNTKMRNDNNVVVIKTERLESISQRRDSAKENQKPEKRTEQKRRSPDEGIQSATESEVSAKRSNSVEMISAKAVEIEISSGDDFDKMPPPQMPTKKTVKKTRTKQKKPEDIPDYPKEMLRATRSRIKEEKISLDKFAQPAPPESSRSMSQNESKVNETGTNKKVTKKKYPMPILVKIEPIDDKVEPIKKKTSKQAQRVEEKEEEVQVAISPCNETFDVAPVNVIMSETVTMETDVNPNATITLEKSSNEPHDSLMTEDNDESESTSEDVPLSALKQKPPPSLPALKLKKNEVFNPYLSSPVKQKVQAFEKHAIHGAATPDKYKSLSSKYSTLKAGTPSKIALFSKTTPLNTQKNQKLISASVGSLVTASAPGYKSHKPLKKMNSLSQEMIDDAKKMQLANVAAQALEEKRKIREEKQRQALLQREALEKEKRDMVLKMQQERDEKYRKLMLEKEQKLRIEAEKKKKLKENQTKKLAQEKAKKDEFVAPKPVGDSHGANNSLYLKLQKQTMMTKTAEQRKAEKKDNYGFDWLDTDDSTDDESRPSKKRAQPPAWSKKQTRKPLIAMQSHVHQDVLDALFSVRPQSIDLREIFPSIDSRKLIRNSSAIWRTPPKPQQHQF